METIFLATIGYMIDLIVILVATIKIKSVRKYKKVFRYILSAVVSHSSIIYYANKNDMEPNILSWIIFIRILLYIWFVMLCAFIEIRIESKNATKDQTKIE